MNKPKVGKFVYPASETEMPIGPYVKAGILVDINAGWRTFRPILDKEKCIKCQTCWIFCPEGVIDRTGDNFEIDYDYCKGCGICANECPKNAISMRKEGENSD
ncbi:4Fe-4S binding protein [Megasphaera paucivorans]|uniref:Pyruvate ferredoxin oxidoreductase delta subunit n=1 Tax=Megasphaera paucivorans TaxID=349095 RepID=A0A1G9WX54_9FIRM|nr:4Fe-4S binding protein [Megasphaera paucivorans]SDM88851.1 pyruvate ferredoxin oxidoreductase delta subunit [Megasphaera paucivorans]